MSLRNRLISDDLSPQKQWQLVRRFALIATLMLVVVALVVGLLITSNRMATVRKLQLDSKSEILVRTERTSVVFKQLVSDMLYLAGKQRVLEYLESRNDKVRRVLIEDFLLFTKTRGMYDQVRLLDTDGKEVIRINNNQGSPVSVSEELLQDKGQRHYFRKGIGLQEGELYISELDLNIENDRIQVPYKPVIRLAAPIVDDHGKKLGLLVTNFLAERLFREVWSTGYDDGVGQVILVNSDGYYLYGKAEDQLYGFMFADKKDNTLQKTRPKLWSAIQGANNRQLSKDGDIIAYEKINPYKAWIEVNGIPLNNYTIPEKNDWYFISEVPKAYVSGQTNISETYIIILGAAFFLIISISLWNTTLANVRKKINEDLLREKEAELSGQFRAINNSISYVEFDIFGKILKVNDIYLDLTGYQRDQVIGRQHGIFLDEHYATSKSYKDFWKRLQSGQFIVDEFERVTRFGKTIWIHGIYNPIIDSEGKVYKIMKLAVDITRQKSLEREVKQQLDTINQSAIVSMTDKEGNIIYANQNFCKISKYSEKELLGKNHRILKSGQQPDGLFVGMWKAISMGRVWRGEICNKAKDGSYYWVDTSIAPFIGLDGKIEKYLAVRLDITEQKLQAQILKDQTAEMEAQQEELRQINEELEEKAGMLQEQKGYLELAKTELETKARQLELTSKYKTEFLANMSHELRTPLNSILILAKLMSSNKNKKLGAKEVEYANNIYNSGNDLLGLIDEILDLSKVEAGKIELEIAEVMPGQIAERMETTFTELAKKKAINFKINMPDEVKQMSIASDQQKIEQIIKNLLSNAFKFTPKNGKITIDVALLSPDSRIVHTGLTARKRIISFSVSDSGIGISADKQEIIFEAFRQADGSTKRKYGGTGLGLSISRELAGILGGQLYLESEEDKGSTFTLFLPLKFDLSMVSPTERKVEIRKNKKSGVGEADAMKQEQEVRMPEAHESKDDRYNIVEGDKVILILEDDEKLADIILEFIRERGYKGLVAHQGNVGLSLARYYRPDAIMLDIKLPVMNGLEVLSQLKNDPGMRHVPVQIFSGYDHRRESLELGAFDFIRKPISEDHLKQSLDKIEAFSLRKLKKLLIIEDDKLQREAIKKLIGNSDVKCQLAESGKKALELMKKMQFDCIIMDLGLQDMTGHELLEKTKSEKMITNVPIIVYTGKDFDREEYNRLRQMTDTVILKTAESHERLLDETMLFLHRVESKLPEDKQHMIRKLHKTEEVLQNKKILIVDDDIRNIYSLTSALEDHGLECIVAENGKIGLGALEANPDIDMVLMDIMMPEMDGYEATREIRKNGRFARLPVIALTAKAMKDDREKCLQAGMSDYVAKPVEVNKLLSLMKVWLYSDQESKQKIVYDIDRG